MADATEILLSDFPKQAGDISDYERIIEAAKVAEVQDKTLVLSGDLYIHKPLVFDGDDTDSDSLCRSIRGTGGHNATISNGHLGSSGVARNGFCRITAVHDEVNDPPSHIWEPEDAVITVRSSKQGENWFSMEKITANANDIAAYGIAVLRITRGTFRDLMAANAKRGGMVFLGCQTSHFTHIKSTFNSGFGILMISCNAAHFYHVETKQNSGDGLVITSEPTQHSVALLRPTEEEKPLKSLGSGGLWIYGFNSEGNGNDCGSGKNFKKPSPQRGHGLVIYKLPGGAHIDGGWIENNRGDGIYIEDGRNSVITNLKMIIPDANNYYDYEPRWLRVTGDKSWGNVIEHNHLELVNGVKEIGIQSFVGSNVWDRPTASYFHGQKHLMVRLKANSEQGDPPTFEDALNLPCLIFKDGLAREVARAKYLNVFTTCLQFVELEVSPKCNRTYTMIWDRSQSDIDPLNQAVTVEIESGNWRARLELVDDRILVTKHQLNRNFYKHNWRHTVKAFERLELQHYIIFGDPIDGNVLEES